MGHITCEIAVLNSLNYCLLLIYYYYHLHQHLEDETMFLQIISIKLIEDKIKHALYVPSNHINLKLIEDKIKVYFPFLLFLVNFVPYMSRCLF